MFVDNGSTRSIKMLPFIVDMGIDLHLQPCKHLTYIPLYQTLTCSINHPVDRQHPTRPTTIPSFNRRRKHMSMAPPARTAATLPARPLPNPIQLTPVLEILKGV